MKTNVDEVRKASKISLQTTSSCLNTMNIQDLNTGQSSLSYEEVEQFGQALPLEWPTPKIRRARYLSCNVRDHHTGSVQVYKVLLPYSRESSTDKSAYWIQKKLSKSTYGFVRLCTVLRRLSRFETGGLDEIMLETTDDLVALKVSSWRHIQKLRVRHLEDPLKEVAALHLVGNYHPNILGCIAAYQDDEHLYMVMPYCSGGDLYGRILGNCDLMNTCCRTNTKQLMKHTEEQSRIWFQQLLCGLYHLQQKGCCHRDICLENLMLKDNGDLAIIDFGLALRVPYIDSNNAFGGTVDVSEGSSRCLITPQGQSGKLCYMAPEIIAKNGPFDGFAIDIWAVGVVLFIMLAGMAPFRWAHPTDIQFQQISQGHLRDILIYLGMQLSDDVCDLLQKMFTPDPRDRLSLADIFEHPWISQTGNRKPFTESKSNNKSAAIRKSNAVDTKRSKGRII